MPSCPFASPQSRTRSPRSGIQLVPPRSGSALETGRSAAVASSWPGSAPSFRSRSEARRCGAPTAVPVQIAPSLIALLRASRGRRRPPPGAAALSSRRRLHPKGRLLRRADRPDQRPQTARRGGASSTCASRRIALPAALRPAACGPRPRSLAPRSLWSRAVRRGR